MARAGTEAGIGCDGADISQWHAGPQQSIGCDWSCRQDVEAV
jgi:hypothetical protein